MKRTLVILAAIGWLAGIPGETTSLAGELTQWETAGPGTPKIEQRPADENMTTETENQLAKEKSPYLRSAAHQPVQWYAWSEQAFQKAQELDRPILLDIGAVWCHWCHVIDRESYENLEIAKLINESFVPVKVDRDERPDIDSRYQLAVSAITGQGGWPLTAFLTPKGDLFYGGTYFPPEDNYGRPGFKSLLRRVAELYKQKREAIHADASRLHQALKENLENQPPAETISGELVDGVMQTMFSHYDDSYGGFGEAPKFPHPSAIELAINRAFFTRDTELTKLITKTLTAMGRGGVYDQIGGGFHRYSTDRQWIVPHFEKMSYDNSELLKNYVHAFQLTGNPFFKEVAQGIVRFVKDVLSDPARGGFYTSQDADINLEDDGDYFTWTRAEAEAVLSQEEAKIAGTYFDIGEQGEMHHNPAKNVLYLAKEIREIAQGAGLDEKTAREKLEAIKDKMLKARNKRPTPFVDRTLYANWNGMMIQAFLEAYKAFGDPSVRDFALKSLDLLVAHAFDESTGFYHAYSEGERRLQGFLEDQIQMASALLSAHEVTGEKSYRDVAEKVVAISVRRFWDPDAGGFFDIEESKEPIGKLAIRQKSIQDSPSPSANAVAALVLEKLAALTGDKSHAERAEATLKAFAPQIPQLGLFAATFAIALDFRLRGPLKVLIVGDEEAPVNALKDMALKTFHPYKIVETVRPRDVASTPMEPALEAILANESRFTPPKAYVCQGPVCQKPTSEPEALKQLIESPTGS